MTVSLHHHDHVLVVKSDKNDLRAARAGDWPRPEPAGPPPFAVNGGLSVMAAMAAAGRAGTDGGGDYRGAGGDGGVDGGGRGGGGGGGGLLTGRRPCRVAPRPTTSNNNII